MAEARFRYAVPLDADNELIAENVHLFHRSLRETGAAAAFGDLLVRRTCAEHAHAIVSNRSFSRTMFAFNRNYIDAFAMLDRVQVRDVGGYDAVCKANEDYELWLHLASLGRRVLFVPVAFGYYFEHAGSMINRENHDENLAVHRLARRMYNQVGARPGLPLETNHLRYHPDLGYL